MEKIFKLVISVDDEKITLSVDCHKGYSFIEAPLVKVVSDYVERVGIDIKEVYDEREHD